MLEENCSERSLQMSRLASKIHPILTEEIIDALHSKQVFTVLDFINADIQQIIKITRLTFREVLAVKNVLTKNFSAFPTNGFDYYKTTLRNTAIIPTGIHDVDHLLNGGLFTGNIYEICGLPASGKTHFALNLAKNVVLNTKQKVYYFDTKNDFSGRRMKKMLDGCNKDQKMETLSKIIVNRAYTKWDLINGLYELKNHLETDLKLRLIIIDSLPTILLNSNDHVKNNLYLNHLVNIMRYISVQHHVAFLITNLITTWNDGDFKNQQNLVESIACGRYWLSVPNIRLKIQKSEDQNAYTFFVVNSDNLNTKTKNSVNILLTDQGFL